MSEKKTILQLTPITTSLKGAWNKQLFFATMGPKAIVIKVAGPTIKETCDNNDRLAVINESEDTPVRRTRQMTRACL